MDIRDYLKEHILILDGGMGTLLQAAGLRPGENSEDWNLSRPEVVTKIHRDYFDAGSNVVNTNTFGANSLKFPPGEAGSRRFRRRCQREGSPGSVRRPAAQMGRAGYRSHGQDAEALRRP